MERQSLSPAMRPSGVLIVEDDAPSARRIENQLLQIGHRVVGPTASGEDAIALAARPECALVLMNVRLQSGLDGIEAARRIRETCRIPVVFLTADPDDEAVKRASHAEPFGYLVKPFETSQLRTVIEMALFKHDAEVRLIDSEQRYAAILAGIGDGVIATDKNARITFANPIASQMTGWAVKDAVGLPLQEVFVSINPENRQVHKDRIDAVLESGKPDASTSHSVLVSKDGREFFIDSLGSPIVDDQGVVAGAVLVFRDVSEVRRVEDALRSARDELSRASRLTTLGELAASIAHEINQPLAAVLTNASAGLNFLLRNDPDIDEVRQVLVDIQRDARRAADVIRSLQALARKTAPEFTLVIIDDVIREVLMLIRGELYRRGVVVRTSLSAIDAPVRADRVQLQQVLLNLIMNGVEAMAPMQDQTKSLVISSICEHSVKVEVQDSGIGIEDQNFDKIFSPFYTTKVGGMGMGLAICKTIVDAHDGRIDAVRRASHGTVFRLDLPIAAWPK